MISPIEVSPSAVGGQIKVARIPQGGRKQLVFRLDEGSGTPVNLYAEAQNGPAKQGDFSPQRNAVGANVQVRLRDVSSVSAGLPSELSLAVQVDPLPQHQRTDPTATNTVGCRSELLGTHRIDVKGNILDQSEHRGFVEFILTNRETLRAGIFEAFIERYIPNGSVSNGELGGYRVDTWPVLLAIEPPAMAMLDTNCSGPLLIPEVRLAILDIDNQSDGAPFSNLLDDTEFTDLDLIFAQRRVVQMWNETPPPVARYTTNDFPYRYWWLEATVGELLRMSAARYRRNRLAYQAGGMAVDDQSKADEYEKIGQLKLEQFKEWMRTEKYRINMNASWSFGI